MKFSRNCLLLLLLTTVTTTVTTTVAFTAVVPPTRTASAVNHRLSTPSLRYVSTSTTDVVNGFTDPNAAANDVSNSSNSNNSNSSPLLPPLGEDDGIYHIENADQHAALLAANPESIVILKCFAPWCRACKGLAPKFLQIRNDPKYADLPLLWADLTIAHNKDFVKSLGVLALPTVQFYVAGQLQDTFPCGPSKVPILKRKLAALVNAHIDAQTRQLKPEASKETTLAAGSSPVSTASIKKDRSAPLPATDQTLVMDDAERKRYVQSVPYLRDLSLADLDDVLDRAKLQTFDAGDIIMREGEPGRTFYMIRTGQVEVCQEVWGAGDPLVLAAPDFLGTLINVLEGPSDYFGERSLMTGEPRAASIRASTKVTTWVLDKTDFPASSVLSGRTRQADKSVDDKYGVSLWNEVQESQTRQLQEISIANQQRGSVNTPEEIAGVDNDEEISADAAAAAVPQQQQPTQELVIAGEATIVDNDAIFTTLNRFHMIRRVRNCLEYIQQSRPLFDEGNRNRRNVLVKRLSPSRRAEFLETFQLLDANNDGDVEMIELTRVMDSLRDDKDPALLQALQQSTPEKDDNGSSSSSSSSSSVVLNKADFMGIMAEAEFFGLFRDIFASLDVHQTGYVKAEDLDRVLCGVRDLISDDRKSLIDIPDKDMHIDYEQFSRLLLGTTLQ